LDVTFRSGRAGCRGRDDEATRQHLDQGAAGLKSVNIRRVLLIPSRWSAFGAGGVSPVREARCAAVRASVLIIGCASLEGRGVFVAPPSEVSRPRSFQLDFATPGFLFQPGNSARWLGFRRAGEAGM
jgi:hypothetical protein